MVYDEIMDSETIEYVMLRRGSAISIIRKKNLSKEELLDYQYVGLYGNRTDMLEFTKNDIVLAT